MKFEVGSSVLFVGEGDFSYSEALSRLDNCIGVAVVASCLQQKLTERASVNTQALLERGVEVIVGVDATKLHMNPDVKAFEFSHVVFNFPHVGGKMKIHLNRNLLYEFFKSASQILKKDGQIIITLCAGQGGIPLDPVVRRWDDTWQVVLMASRTDLIIRKIEEFDVSKYCGYSATGYRSMEKGFHQQGAFMYIFERYPNERVLINADVMCAKDISLYDGSFMQIPYFTYSQIKRSLLSDMSTLIGQLCCIIQKHFSTSVPLYSGKNMIGTEIIEIKDILKYAFDPHIDFSKGAYVHPLYILKKTDMYRIDLLLAFVYLEKLECMEILLLENLNLDILDLNKSFIPKHKQIIWKDLVQGPHSVPLQDLNNLQILQSSSSSYYGHSKDLHIFTLNITQLVNLYFEVDEDELWAYGQSVSVVNKTITYSPYSLFPLKYVYDLSFWQPKTNNVNNTTLDEQQKVHNWSSLELDAVGIIITNIAKDLLIDFELLSTYFHPKNKRKSFTYRIRYRSFYSALSDDRAKCIHLEIGRKLEECLGVEIR